MGVWELLAYGIEFNASIGLAVLLYSIVPSQKHSLSRFWPLSVLFSDGIQALAAPNVRWCFSFLSVGGEANGDIVAPHRRSLSTLEAFLMAYRVT